MDESEFYGQRALEVLDALAGLMDISSSYVIGGMLVVTGVSLPTGKDVTLSLDLTPPEVDLWSGGGPARC